MNKEKTVLVCITPQESSKQLVKSGKVLAEKHGAKLEVVSVLPLCRDGSEFRIEPDAIEKLYQTAKSENGEMAVYFSDDPILTVSAHIAKRKPLTLVTGFPGERSNNFISAIHLLVHDVPISMVGEGGTVYNILPYEAMQSIK
jgi:K+-sensing histidine kinase KdpD